MKSNISMAILAALMLQGTNVYAINEGLSKLLEKKALFGAIALKGVECSIAFASSCLPDSHEQENIPLSVLAKEAPNKTHKELSDFIAERRKAPRPYNFLVQLIGHPEELPFSICGDSSNGCTPIFTKDDKPAQTPYMPATGIYRYLPKGQHGKKWGQLFNATVYAVLAHEAWQQANGPKQTLTVNLTEESSKAVADRAAAITLAGMKAQR
ncbi:MAG TPA: hypothetical protein VFF04_02655 [Candidatus Babeliales bacterium]|nr:hypothetical protein [Candidatus Babeliales bacterium]